MAWRWAFSWSRFCPIRASLSSFLSIGDAMSGLSSGVTGVETRKTF
jgi:hypothetical protein